MGGGVLGGLGSSLQLFWSGFRVPPSLQKHLARSPSTFTQMSPQLRLSQCPARRYSCSIGVFISRKKSSILQHPTKDVTQRSVAKKTNSPKRGPNVSKGNLLLKTKRTNHKSGNDFWERGQRLNNNSDRTTNTRARLLVTYLCHWVVGPCGTW